MEAYTIIALIKQLLAAGVGIKGIVLLAVLGSMAFCAYRAVKFVAAILERLVANRDAMLSETMTRIVQMDARRAEHDKETATILATIRADTASQLNEARESRKEMHQRFNRMSEEHTTMKESLAEIKGGLA